MPWPGVGIIFLLDPFTTHFARLSRRTVGAFWQIFISIHHISNQFPCSSVGSNAWSPPPLLHYKRLNFHLSTSTYMASRPPGHRKQSGAEIRLGQKPTVPTLAMLALIRSDMQRGRELPPVRAANMQDRVGVTAAHHQSPRHLDHTRHTPADPLTPGSLAYPAFPANPSAYVQ